MTLPRASDSEIPKLVDDRLVIELFAASPEIVHPVACAFDGKGRLLVIESHTHFPPADYKGPKTDRIRVLEDTDGDGKADKFSTFFEGLTHTMDILTHPDGSIYVATRNEVLRLTDTQGTGVADKKERIAYLDTKANYPHNGLSGLCFDIHGNLNFGLGENFNSPFTLTGTDGSSIHGDFDGGMIFTCKADGTKLTRLASGFWNPFGIECDIYGRIFAVDNDPDGMPPCRMLHIIPQGDYGYQYRYGREGRHPFQAWNGQLPGTLPMMTGVGEAPCEILTYESDGLPKDYLGDSLVTSWAEHRLERYTQKHKGSSFAAFRKPFIQGGANFRPSGLTVAPDGSLFIADWVKPDYQLHGQGAVWHVRMKHPKKPKRPDDPKEGVLSFHRPLREASARKLAATEEGRTLLRSHVKDENEAGVRAASIIALLNAGDTSLDLLDIAKNDKEPGIQALATRVLAQQGKLAFDPTDTNESGELRRESIPAFTKNSDTASLSALLDDPDPFIVRSAIVHLSNHPELLEKIPFNKLTNDKMRAGLLLAIRHSDVKEREFAIILALNLLNEDVRLLAVKWISDDRIQEVRPLIVEALKSPRLSVRMVQAYATALASIDGKEVNEAKMGEYFIERLQDKSIPAPSKAMFLKQVPAKHPQMKLEILKELLEANDPALTLEVVRMLGEHPSPGKVDLLKNLLMDTKQNETIRAEALVHLSSHPETIAPLAKKVAIETKPPLRDEALRALVKHPFTAEEKSTLEKLANDNAQIKPLVQRLLGKNFFEKRPTIKDVDAWLKLLEGPADVEAGRRIFSHPRLATCVKCHRMDGRGVNLGPDLSDIGRNNRRLVLESILNPSSLVAPHYQTWQVETTQGKIKSGMLIRTYLDENGFLDSNGDTFMVKSHEIAEMRAISKSIMPDNLVDHFTDQELRDLLAYLMSRK